MRVLVLGGTQFVGRHLVEALLAAKHEVTLFHRGRSHKGLFPDAQEVYGDRDGGLDSLQPVLSERFDWVVDTCGYVPRVVEQSVQALKDHTERYLFISTVSVYPDFSKPGLTEDAGTRVIKDPETEVIDARTYGALKALCEERVLAAFGERAFIPRPGIIAGPYDPTDRFPYWVDRAAQSAPFLLPDVPDQPVQLIDARDLGAWCVRQMELGTTGIYNTAGPQGKHTFQSMIDACLQGTPGLGQPVAMAPEAILAHEIHAGQDLPLWIPDPEIQSLFEVDSGRAEAAGLTHRPLAEVARDTYEWLQTLPADRKWTVGLSRERESKALPKG